MKYQVGELVRVFMLDGSTITGAVVAVREHPRRPTRYKVAGAGWVSEDARCSDDRPVLTRIATPT